MLDVQPLGDISRRDIADAIADSNRIPTSLAPRYGVTTYRLSYLTQDKDGALVRASGLVALPVRPAGATPSAAHSMWLIAQQTQVFYALGGRVIS